MTPKRIVAIAALMGLPLALSGCLSFGGESSSAPAEDPLEPGEPASAGDFAAYSANLASVEAMPLTGNLPTAGTAEFNGETMMALTNTQTDTVTGDVMGDLTLLVDFAPGAYDPVTTTISNIQLMEANGDIYAIGGTLESDPDVYASSIETTPAEVSDGQGGTVTVQTGTLDSTATGSVSDGEETFDMTVNLDGTFQGDGAQGASGTATGTVDNYGNPGVWVLDGTFWVMQ